MSCDKESIMRLSVEAYLLARECGRISGLIKTTEKRFSDSQYSALSEELTFFYSRMMLLGGHLAGFIKVDRELDLDAEQNYMETCRSFLQSLNSVLEA